MDHLNIGSIIRRLQIIPSSVHCGIPHLSYICFCGRRLNANVNKWKWIRLHKHARRLNMHVIQGSFIRRTYLISPSSLPSAKHPEWDLSKINSFMIYRLAACEPRCTSKQPDIQLSAALALYECHFPGIPPKKRHWPFVSLAASSPRPVISHLPHLNMKD